MQEVSPTPYPEASKSPSQRTHRNPEKLSGNLQVKPLPMGRVRKERPSEARRACGHTLSTSVLEPDPFPSPEPSSPGPCLLLARGKGKRRSLSTFSPSRASSQIPRGPSPPAVRTGSPGRVVSHHPLPQCPSHLDGSEVAPRQAQDKAQGKTARPLHTLPGPTAGGAHM